MLNAQLSFFQWKVISKIIVSCQAENEILDLLKLIYPNICTMKTFFIKSNFKLPFAGQLKAKSFKNFYLALSISMVMIAATSCDKQANMIMLEPAGPKPVWGPTIAPEMKVIIEKLINYNNPPLPTLTPAQARMGKSIFTAFDEVRIEQGIAKPHATVDTVSISIPCTDGNIPALVYSCGKGKGPFPVIVYFHGGGWVLNSPKVYDASARALADMTGAIVVSVSYRKAPEYKFPVAHNDSFNAFKWVLKNASSINGNPEKVAVAGESAGGNLAAAVSLMARDKGIKLPIHQLLVYPIANYDFNTESYNEYAAAVPLDKPSMQWFFGHYLPDPSFGANPLISLVNANLTGLPPTTIISAEIDPLQSEGLLLAQRLTAAGVKVVQKTFIGTTHEFFGMAAIVPQAQEAQKLASSELKKAFQ